MRENNSGNLFKNMKRFQPAARWSAVVFFLMVLGIMLAESHPKVQVAPLEPLWVLVLVWSIPQIFATVPLILLLLHPDLRKIHTAVRMKVVFKYLSSAWLTFSVFWFRYEDMHGNLFGREPALVLIGISVLILIGLNWLLPKRYMAKPETMFP